MSTAMDYYNPHSTLEWDGLRSAKFGRTKYFVPKRDTINLGKPSILFTGLEFPNQTPKTGRKHYQERRSP